MSGPIVLGLRLLLAVGLYAFLGWAFINLWREIKQQGVILSGRRVPPIRLSITHCDQTSQVQRFSKPEVTIGRDQSCECPLNDETVSARHARLSYHHHQWWLEDLNSTNGVLLNREKISMPVVVMTDDEFTCGKTRFIIVLDGEAASPSAQ